MGESSSERLRAFVLAEGDERAATLCGALSGCDTTLARSLDPLRSPERDGRFDLVVVACDRPGVCWRDALALGARRVVAAVADAAEAAELLARGGYDFLEPPFEAARVDARLRCIVQRVAEERALWRALDLASVSVEETDETARIRHVGEAFERLTGYHRDEAIGRTPAELVRSGAHPPSYYEDGMAQLRAGAAWRGLLVSRRKDGSLFSADVSVAPAVSGPVRRYFAVRRETTAEEAAAARARVLMDSATDAILVADFDSALFIDSNPAARALLGYGADELRALNGRALTSPGQDEPVAALSAALHRDGRAQHDQIKLRRKDGSDFWGQMRLTVFEVAGSKLYATVIRDVTDRVVRERELERSYRELHHAQAQLVHASKLASVGELAAGVAHEVNNPATYAMLALGEAREWIAAVEAGASPTLAELSTFVGEGLDGLERIAAIARDLTTFARVESAEHAEADLGDVCRVALRLAQNQLRHRATVAPALGPVAHVRGEASKLTQVVLNLLVNAAHAVDGKLGGVVSIRTVAADDRAGVQVEDNGPGIPAELRERIFEPFFTTKRKGHGTGLGLSLSREIVESLGGTIWLRSELGSGSCFTMWLPVARLSQPLRSKSTLPPAPARRARVLLVDDDPMVLKAMARALRQRCDVVTAGAGAEAVAKLRDDPAFDLVMCDLMMPDVDGPGVYRAAVLRRPALRDRFLFVSGGVFSGSVSEFLETVAPPVLQKPVTAERIHRVLAAWMAGEPLPLD